MSQSKIIKIITEKIKIDAYVISIFFVLILIALIAAINLVNIISLRKQTRIVLSNTLPCYVEHNPISNPVAIENITAVTGDNLAALSESNGTALTGLNLAPLLEPGILSSSSISIINPLMPVELINVPQPLFISNNPPVILKPSLIITPAKTYSNIFSEQFFGKVYIDNDKTNLRLDDNLTALTFNPVYQFSYEKSCAQPFCNLKSDASKSCLGDKCLTQANGQIYYQNNLVNLPLELKDKKIINITFSPLESKWVVGFIASSGSQDLAYAYFFDNNNFSLLPIKLSTNYSFGSGSVSAGGTDNQFMVLYSGYEGLAYLYNDGNWQNLSQYFGFRVTNRGFNSKIIKSGEGVKAQWYICSEDASNPKLVKLWQNNTKSIQGAIDLSSILDGGEAICSYRSNQELNIARSDGLYIFKDSGFDNSHNYLYQSKNISSFKDKKITNVYLSTYTINAPDNLYTLYFSVDGKDWQKTAGGEIKFQNGTDSLYVKAEFKSGDMNYSPWFGGLETILYSGIDR